ncbi:NAD(P)-dependent oxidoreductase [Metabacillus halosaccharovorans]|uniref:NAD(P)-dependent oxidoreductase n=1 Tax=Metabacillus halosaccharovorans TaxID=930124 RepID=UPI00203E062C|nr:NAD(P)-dependent oxidoreductase [Metabacillus halosaccharovorans]MCM3441160.1 precorrin-2 dehydrogenase [Metabacillus halosaccharovorans]
MLPLHIDVNNRQVLVIGGGKIAYRRLLLFLDEGANITVISPEIINDIEDLSQKKQILWKQKKVELSDLQQAFIIVAATNDPAVNEWVAENVNNHQLVNVASDMTKGNFIVPKSVKKGRLSISVSTNGASPKRAKEICEQLSSQFDEEYINELDRLYDQRQLNKQQK